MNSFRHQDADLSMHWQVTRENFESRAERLVASEVCEEWGNCVAGQMNGLMRLLMIYHSAME